MGEPSTSLQTVAANYYYTGIYRFGRPNTTCVLQCKPSHVHAKIMSCLDARPSWPLRNQSAPKTFLSFSFWVCTMNILSSRARGEEF
jgi:hypothetical protein